MAHPDDEAGEEPLEALTGSGGLRKGADMFIPPLDGPVDEPTPMPVNMAPGPPVEIPQFDDSVPSSDSPDIE